MYPEKIFIRKHPSLEKITIFLNSKETTGEELKQKIKEKLSIEIEDQELHHFNSSPLKDDKELISQKISNNDEIHLIDLSKSKEFKGDNFIFVRSVWSCSTIYVNLANITGFLLAKEIKNTDIFNNDIFIFAGRKIELNDKLSDLGIEEGSTIHQLNTNAKN